jgi:hypothetical protein
MVDKGQIKIRLVPALRRQLEKASEKSGRSLNNEIVWRLGKSFEVDALDMPLTDWGEIVTDVIARIEKLEKKK